MRRPNTSTNRHQLQSPSHQASTTTSTPSISSSTSHSSSASRGTASRRSPLVLLQCMAVVLLVGTTLSVLLLAWHVPPTTTTITTITTIHKTDNPTTTTKQPPPFYDNGTTRRALTHQRLPLGHSDNHNTTTATTTTTSTHLPMVLPVWMQEYIAWHQTMRRHFPGRQLWEHPDAPKLLIRTCLGLCGGWHDRVGQLPTDLYLAHQLQRVYLIHWHRPVPLEHFVQPPSPATNPWALDWRVPPEIPSYFPTPPKDRLTRVELRVVRSTVPDLFEGSPSDHPTDEFWYHDVPKALERAKTGAHAHHHVLRHRVLGHLHPHILEEWLRQEQENRLRNESSNATWRAMVADDSYWNVHAAPYFGNLFHALFQPSDAVQAELNRVQRDELGVSSSTPTMSSMWDGVHCRVRHPKATATLVQGIHPNHPADKSGLPWKGPTKDFAIALATHALNCAVWLRDQQEPQSQPSIQRPIYFFSDSNDLVAYFQELQQKHNHNDQKGRPVSAAATAAERAAHDLFQSSSTKRIHLLTRNISQVENAHLDRQKGRPPAAYFGTIVDFYLALQSRCVTFGIGFYAAFAAQVSGTHCTVQYQRDAWTSPGMTHQPHQHQQQHQTPFCPLPPPPSLVVELPPDDSESSFQHEKEEEEY